MKKTLFILTFLFALVFVGCKNNINQTNNKTEANEETITENKESQEIDYDDILARALDTINFEDGVDNFTDFPEVIVFENYRITIHWSWNVPDHMIGEVIPDFVKQDVRFIIMAELEGVRKTKTIDTFIKAIDINDYIENVLKVYALPSVIEEDIDLIDYFALEGIELEYICDNPSIDSLGKFTPATPEGDFVTEIKVNIKYKDINNTYSLGVAQIASMEYLCNKALEKISLPDSINDDIELPRKDGFVIIEWTSSYPRILGNDGTLRYTNEVKQIKMSSTLYIDNEFGSFFLDKNFFITVNPWDLARRVQLIKDNLFIPNETKFDIYLPTEFDYDVKCKYSSSDTSLLTNYGHVINGSVDTSVILTCTFYDEFGSEEINQEFEIKILHLEEGEMEGTFYNHNLIDRVSDFIPSNFSGLVLDGDRVKLASGALVGTYDSKIYTTLDFRRVVGSFSCITTPDATCELAISIRVKNTWSKYFSYGEFGLGRNNLYYDQTDTYSYMDTDMIEPNSGLSGNGVKYRITLRRKNAETKSPELGLVAVTLFLNNYTYAVDASSLPDFVDWDVPKLYQHDVPSIGGVICSATTTTMLLKFAGFDFSNKGYTYEHEYMANMVADRGHNNPTYGNWSYNMMAAGAYGVNAYVGKFYSWDELRYHLVHVGPVGCSIGGNFGIYTTAGHLIVIRGYRISNGETTVICNDPNVKGVYYEVTLETFLRCWGSVIYIIEYDKLN